MRDYIRNMLLLVIAHKIHPLPPFWFGLTIVVISGVHLLYAFKDD